MRTDGTRGLLVANFVIAAIGDTFGLLRVGLGRRPERRATDFLDCERRPADGGSLRNTSIQGTSSRVDTLTGDSRPATQAIGVVAEPR